MRSGRAELAQDRSGLARRLRRVRGDPGIERLALPDRGVERAHRLLERGVRVEAMRVEDVDVVQAEPLETLIEAREHVLPRAPLPVRARPHVVAGLRRDDELVAVRLQVSSQKSPEVLLRRAVRRPVVVREVEVRDAEVERATHDRATRVERAVVTEVPPEPEGDRRELQATPARAAVHHGVVALLGGDVAHSASLVSGERC